MKSILGNFYRHLAILSGHTDLVRHPRETSNFRVTLRNKTSQLLRLSLEKCAFKGHSD